MELWTVKFFKEIEKNDSGSLLTNVFHSDNIPSPRIIPDLQAGVTHNTSLLHIPEAIK
jgi:hypothetical protein